MHALAVRQDNNGDVLLTGPAVRALAAAFDRVTMLASPHGAAAASLLPGVGELVVARAEWIDGAPRSIERAAVEALIARLAGLAIDEAFIFTSWHQSALPTALLLRLAGVTRIHAISEDYPGSLLDTRAIVPNDIHEVERNLRLLELAGIPARGDDRLRMRDLPPRAPDLPSAYVVVHPGASVPARAWSPERNASLVDTLVRRGESVIVTGTPDERALVERVAGAGGIVCCDRSFAEYSAIVRDARAIIVGNTAGAHVASAVETPVVSIFPPTIPAVRFRPWGVTHELLGDQTIVCAGCRARRCPIEGQPCIGNLSVDDVLGALDRIAPRPSLVIS